jgi:hypothetical protein
MNCPKYCGAEKKKPLGAIDPVPQIVRVSMEGLVILRWNTDMIPPKNLTSLTLLNEKTQRRPITIFLEAGSDFTDQSKLGIKSYNVTYWKNRDMHILLDMDYPLYVSGNPIFDKISI